MEYIHFLYAALVEFNYLIAYFNENVGFRCHISLNTYINSENDILYTDF